MKWPFAAAKTRDGITDALATVTPVLASEDPGRPSIGLLRTMLRTHLLPPAARGEDTALAVASAARWLRRASLPLSALTDATIVRAALDSLAIRLDGRPAAATTTRRRRAVFYNVLQYAVELELLAANPVDGYAFVPRAARSPRPWIHVSWSTSDRHVSYSWL
jgi:hypothetical protein